MNNPLQIGVHHMGTEDITLPEQFCAKTELENPQPLPKDVNFLYPVYEFNVRDLGYQLAFLLAMIESLSVRFGYCFMSNHTFAARLNKSLPTIERWLKILSDKKLIYRNTWNKPKGKARHIVPRSKYMEYWRSFMMKPNIPPEVRKEFLSHIFNGDVPDIPPPKGPPSPPPKTPPKGEGLKGAPMYTTLKSDGTHTTLKNDGCLLLRNISNNKEITTEEASASTPVAVDSFEKKIEIELLSLKMTEEQLKVALEYYRLYKTLVDSKENPVGWIINGMKQGWIADAVQKKREPLPEAREEERTLINGALSCKTHLFIKSIFNGIDNEEVRVSVGERVVYIHFKKKNSTAPLDLRDDKTLQKLYNFLGNHKLWDLLNRYVKEFPEELKMIFNPPIKEKVAI